MKKIFLPLFILSLILSGCANFVDDVIIERDDVKTNDMIIVKGTLELSGSVPSEIKEAINSSRSGSTHRSAIPSIPAEAKFIVTAECAGKTPVTKEAEYDDVSKKYLFEIGLSEGSWTITAALKTHFGTPQETIVLKDTTTKKLTSDNPVVNVPFYLRPLTEGTGGINLDIYYTGTGIDTVEFIPSASCKTEWEKGNGSLTTDTVSATLIKTGLKTGIYDITILFKKDGALVYCTSQTINIFANMTTDSWVSGGGAGPIDASGDFNVTTALTAQFERSTFYVDGTNGNDTTGTGSPYSPLNSLSKAVSLANVSAETGTKKIFIKAAGSETLSETLNFSKDINVEVYTTAIGDKTGSYTLNRASTFRTQMISIAAGNNVSISGLVLDGKNYAGTVNGMGINNNGILTLTGCTLKNCKSTGNGKSIYQNGELYLNENNTFDSDNEIYLTDGKLINLQNNLANEVPIYVKVTEAKIENLGQVLDGKSSFIQSSYKKLKLMEDRYIISKTGYIDYKTIYVSGESDGNDSTGDGSEETPYKTLGKALEANGRVICFAVKGETSETRIFTINDKKVIRQWEGKTAAVIKRATSFRGRMIVISTEGRLDLENVTLHGGSYSINFDGSGIYNEGILNLTDATISSCKCGSSYKGGAIYNKGTINFNKNISGNVIGNSDATRNATSSSNSNYAGSGAAIYTESDMELKYLSVIYNYTYNHETIYGKDCEITLGEELTFNKNESNSKNLYIIDGTIKVDESISENKYAYLKPADYSDGTQVMSADNTSLIISSRKNVVLVNPENEFWQIDDYGKIRKITDIKDCYYTPNTSGNLTVSTPDSINRLIEMGEDGISDVTLKLTFDCTTPITRPIENFNSVFDGDGHTIKINMSGETGFITRLNGTIKNLTLEGNSQAAGFIYTGSGTIDNCISRVTVRSSNYDYVGGFCAYINSESLTIQNSKNEGNVTNSKSGYTGAGGFVGYNTQGNVTIKNCTNTAAVEAPSWAGGIIARQNGGTISNSVNSGTVSFGSKSATGTAQFYTNAGGGICGVLCDGTIENCLNAGEVTTINLRYTHVGGIVGIGPNQNPESDSRYKPIINNCLNIGTLSGGSKLGGIYGGNYQYGLKSVSNNWYRCASGDTTTFGAGGTNSNLPAGTYTKFMAGANQSAIDSLNDWRNGKTGYSEWKIAGGEIVLDNGI